MQNTNQSNIAKFHENISLDLNALQSIVPLEYVTQQYPGTVVRLKARVVTSTVTRRISWELLAYYEKFMEPEVLVADHAEFHPSWGVWGSSLGLPNNVATSKTVEDLKTGLGEGTAQPLPKSFIQVLALDGLQIFGDTLLNHIRMIRGAGYRLECEIKTVEDQSKYHFSQKAHISRFVNMPFRSVSTISSKKMCAPFFYFTFPEDTTQQTHDGGRIVPAAYGYIGFAEQDNGSVKGMNIVTSRSCQLSDINIGVNSAGSFEPANVNLVGYRVSANDLSSLVMEVNQDYSAGKNYRIAVTIL